MTEVATLLARLDGACARIERALVEPRPTRQALAEAERRYDRLRAETQAALAQLETVIAAVETPA